MRRLTLGVIDPNANHERKNDKDKVRRFSTAPPRKSLLERKSGRGVRFSSGRPSGRPSMGMKSIGRPSIGALSSRSSMGRQSMGRRQSVGPRRSSMYNRSGKITDPRPLSDRKYVNKNTRVLVEYLTNHNYDKQITPKQVTAPSLKDFKNICSFLFKQMDPNFEFSKNFEDDVKDSQFVHIPLHIREMLKVLGYPFTISKSSLSAVGSPHTWPPILAMLCWLIELLNYLEELEEEEQNAIEKDDGKMFFEYLASAYKNFLDGNGSGEDLEGDFKAAYAARCESIQEEINE
eukprot:1362881-Amorphochlora_amoeboformis.AAC.2